MMSSPFEDSNDEASDDQLSLDAWSIDPSIDEPSLDDEIMAARQAVIRAQKRLLAVSAVVFDDLVEQPDPDDPDSPVSRRARDEAEAEHIAEALAEARRRSNRPFGRNAAKRVVALELAGRLVLDRLAEDPSAEEIADDSTIDLAELERARTGVQQAEDHLRQLLDLPPAPLPRRQRPWRPISLS
jgi:hypothetical protein